jgi:hypothetical protein
MVLHIDAFPCLLPAAGFYVFISSRGKRRRSV